MTTSIPDASLREMVLSEYTSRRLKNHRYSFRAYARDLGISKSSLSDFLADKRGISGRTAEKIADALALSPLQIKSLKTVPASSHILLEEDRFRMIVDWYYFAILSLARLPNARANKDWIARRLGISELEVQNALDRLMRLGLVKKQGSRLVRTTKSITTTDDIPSAALKVHHEQNFARAEKALKTVKVDLREISSVTFPADPKQIEAAKKLVRIFRKKLVKTLETKNASEVYTFAVQLFPQTIPEDRK